MSGPGPRRRRVRMPYVEWLVQILSDRDWAIIETVHRVRIASGNQLERLLFQELAVRSRSVMRWRVLQRLVDTRVLMTFERRVGMAGGGSSALRYVLDSAGIRLVRLRTIAASTDRRVRRPRAPGQRFVAHALAVTELYVALVEAGRLGGFVLHDFLAEAAAYWPNGLGGWVKPDAFIQVSGGTVTDYWWYEADMATEDLSTIRAKLLAFVDFVVRGQLGPEGIVPRVLVGVPSEKRRRGIQKEIDALPEPAGAMFVVALMDSAVNVLIRELTK